MEGAPQKIRLNLSPEAARYARRDAPIDARRMAAGGALPLPPGELATVLFVLLQDPDAEVKARARESLESLPDEVATTVVSGEIHPALLSYLARIYQERSDRLERIALNPNTDDATIVFLATLPQKTVVDMVANNQERMLRCPEIVDALGQNALTGRAAIDRILSFMGLERPEAEVVEDDEDLGPPPSLDDLTDEDARAALESLLGDDASGIAQELLEDSEEELEESVRGNLHALIQRMNVMQKIKLARLGNLEARGILVRDNNKIVATAAIRSPKITDMEVAKYALSRNLHDEVLRVIATHREWTSQYQVKHALARNPKTPLPQALKFLNYLQDRDLRMIMKSREVTQPVAVHARRILSKKGKL